MREKRITVWVQRFKDRPSLMLQWIDPETGARKSKSSNTASEQEAELARADLEYELNHWRHQQASKIQWERFRQMFHDEYAAGLRDRSAEKYETVFDVFEQIINPAKLRAITERTISAFVRGMRERAKRGGKVGLAPHTIKNYLINLKTALTWAVSQKLIPELPAFPLIKVPKKKPQPIPAESFEKLVDKAPDASWKAFLLCGWWAGLRLSEAYQLQWDRCDDYPWIDFEWSRIILPAVFVKADVDQWVPLHPVLRQALAGLPRDESAAVFDFRSRSGKPLSRMSVTHHVLALAKKAGVKLSMQKLRKGFGCRVAQQLGRGNAPVLHTLMRHSSMQVTLDYYASVDDALQSAMQELT
jgi:integrase